MAAVTPPFDIQPPLPVSHPPLRDQLIQVGIAELPSIIAWVRDAFVKKHPDEPEPTSAEVLAVYQDLFTRDEAIDLAFLAERQPLPPEQD